MRACPVCNPEDRTAEDLREALGALRAFAEQYVKLAGFPAITGPFSGVYMRASGILREAREREDLQRRERE